MPLLGTFGAGSKRSFAAGEEIILPDDLGINDLSLSTFPIAQTATNTLTYTIDNPDFYTTRGATPITDTQYWKRLQLTPSLTGTRRIYFKTQLPSTLKANPPVANNNIFYGDVQVAAVEIFPSGGGTSTQYRFTEARRHLFEQSVSTQADSSQPVSWKVIPNDANPGGGFFGLKFEGGITGSTETGRLVPPFTGTVLSYMYSETSSPVAEGWSIWMRSPEITINSGDSISVLMGEDAIAAESFTISVQ